MQPVIPLRSIKDSDQFRLSSDILAPGNFHIVFIVLLDGDLVMSPEHLGIAIMASLLRNAGFTVTVVDVTHDTRDAAAAEVLSARPNLIGFTLMHLNLASWFEMSARLRVLLPSVPMIIGGPAATNSAEQLLRANPNVEAAVIGEGEATVFEIVQRLYLRLPITECLGTCVRVADGTIRRNPVRPLLTDLDVLPEPARDQLERHGKRLPYIRISTSRGCIGQCGFCCAPHIRNRFQPGKVWRARSPKVVVDEIEGLVQKYRFRTYDFIDSSFEDPGNLGKARLAEIAKLIIGRKLDIYYNCCLRAENWSSADDELLELLVQSGLEKVNVGIESGTPWELELWRKRATVSDNERIIELLHRHGVYLAMGFIQFQPYSTVESLTTNANFLRKNYGHNLRRLTERLEICPGMAIVEQLKNDGLLTRDDPLFGHYEYHYKDEAIERLANYFASLYNNDDYHQRGVITKESAVFKFETFNVVVATFWSRIYRRFRHIPGVMEELNWLRDQVQSERQKASDFNHEFFLTTMGEVLAERLDPQENRNRLERIDAFLHERMVQIRTFQLRAGRRLERCGVSMREIASSFGDAQPASKVAIDMAQSA